MPRGAVNSYPSGIAVFCVFTAACASVPQGKFGVSSLEVRGVKRIEKSALLTCLATQKRPGFGFSLGPHPEPACGVAPFDAERMPVELWTWPWTPWPLYEQRSLERDLERIERWYRARGFYQAEVTQIQIDRDGSDREVDITIDLKEGKPVVVAKITLVGIEPLTPEERRQAREAVSLKEGDRFDEATYDASKKALAEALAEASYAQASVKGRVSVDAERMEATVSFEITPGPSCRFGRVVIEGNRQLPAGPIIGAAEIKPGSRFSQSKLKEAQDAIYALGAFASVEITPQSRAGSNVVDVRVRVVPARRLRLAVGAGIEAGTPEGLQTYYAENLARWDVHLLARAEHRNFLGGMRRIRVEERPRLIFARSFPQIGGGPKPGNLLMMELKQPALLESRTALTLAAEWDYGPDPYGGDFTRHDVDTWIGPGRYFFGRALFLSGAIHLNLFIPQNDRQNTCTGETLQRYYVTFMEYVARVDQRDDVYRTTRGWYAALSLQHAGYFLPSDWNYIRVTPEARGYLPLPWHFVLAGRVRLGALEITGSKISGDQDLQKYGPYRYRLRGGGPNSVRGFNPNLLGDVREARTCLLTGGLRQWEGSLELRIPVTYDVGTVLFIDAGDVTIEKQFRFNYPQTTVGFGVRYNTIVGPLRFDIGILPNGLQVFGTDRRPNPQAGELFGINGVNGAWHLSIGEAF
jgi:outer membrane protein assembly factor BamA